MCQQSITPLITVTIGDDTREYRAYITTAPAQLDMPKTVTVSEGPFWEVVGLAADPVTHDALRACTPARLVLVEQDDYGPQRDQYRGNQHLFLFADRWLVGLHSLQFFLWQRIEGRVASPMAA
jgi:hypothetical protein